MNPRDLIDTYVEDVVRRLPRKLRNDIAAELDALLQEELAALAVEAGRQPDEGMVLNLLRGFGAPAEVARRYHQPLGLTILRPQDTAAFVVTAVAGLLLQWAVSLTLLFNQAGTSDLVLQRLGAWWMTAGLGAFWWPGFLVMAAMIAAWARRRWPGLESAPADRVIDRDRVSRVGMAIGLAFGILGAAFWILEPWLMDHAPSVLAAVLRFDPEFLSGRAGWVLPLWAAQLALCIHVIREGRWTRRTRQLSLLASLSFCLLIAWYIVAGPVFAAVRTDQTAKVLAAIVVVLSLVPDALRLAGQSRHLPPDRRGTVPA